MKSLVLPSIAVLSLAGCAASSNDASSANESRLIGGSADTQYPAVGYLVGRILQGPQAGQVVRGYCTATLIAPNAVLTTASCASEKLAKEAEVIGVGFGDVMTGPTYEVTGASDDWFDQNALQTFMDPGTGEEFSWIDTRYDLAVVPLRTAVTGMTPMRMNSAAIAPNTPATVVGYGKTVESTYDPAHDDIGALVDGEASYPTARQSIRVDISVARNFIEAYPPSGSQTGTCFRDFGSPLVLENGVVAGVFATWDGDTTTAAMFDGLSLCRKDAGGRFVNFRFGNVAVFIREKLAAIAANAKGSR